MSHPRCCPPPCPPKVCAKVVKCPTFDGAAVTVTGPGSFSASGTTDATGWWCTPATTPGDYDVTVGGDTKTVVVGTDCTSYTASFSIGTLATVCLTFTKCWDGGDPFVGLSVRLVQGANTWTDTTDSAGKVCFPLPSNGPSTAYVDSPPCPYSAASFSIPGIPLCGTHNESHTLPWTGDYSCFCVGFLIPMNGYSVSLACGSTTIGLGQFACIGFTTDQGAKLHAKTCGHDSYGNPVANTVLEHTSLYTGVGVAISCASGEWSLTLTWVNEFGILACGETTPDTNGFLAWDGVGCSGFGPIGFSDPPCVKDFPFFSCINWGPTQVELTIPLTGTVVDHSISLSGSIPGSVWVDPFDSIPGGWASTPCPGGVTVTRSWC